MAHAHLVSGACAGAAYAGLLVHVAGAPVALALACAALTTWATLLPDIDSPRSTIVRQLGPLGRPAHRLAVAAVRIAHALTRTHRDGPDAGDGHRYLTHTLVAAVGTGTVVALLSPLPAAGIDAVLEVAFPAALPGAVPAGRGTVAGTVLGDWAAGIVGWGAGVIRAAGDWGFAVGAAAGTGHAVGALGDCLTPMGAPVAWPLAIRGKRWWRVRSPWTFPAGSEFEHRRVVPVLYVALAVITVGALGWWPPIVAAGSELIGALG